MNKQELIEKLKEYGAWCTECHDIHGEKDRYVKVAKVRELLEQLDEPQKVKVPEFVAKWFETNKYVLDRAILDYMFEDYASDDSEFGKWFDNKNGKPIETLVRMLDGYEVEEEPKWKIINDQKYCLTSIEAGYDNSLHWAFDSTKKKPILFDNEETAMYTAYITGGIVEKVEV
ncbi:DUF1642 domain-containing protein [Enterococcus devriesei]|uniref:DUF1642 domain-containing protein n=1 Tax=Enterococcus devriesei TaxID=319970 RepID=UPI0028E6B578|nr:DUF1642 domain-containing protein [Enterococcus devriesei]